MFSILCLPHRVRDTSPAFLPASAATSLPSGPFTGARSTRRRFWGETRRCGGREPLGGPRSPRKPSAAGAAMAAPPGPSGARVSLRRHLKPGRGGLCAFIYKHGIFSAEHRKASERAGACSHTPGFLLQRLTPGAAQQGSPSGSMLCSNKLLWPHAWASCKYCDKRVTGMDGCWTNTWCDRLEISRHHQILFFWKAVTGCSAKAFLTY